MIKFINVDLDGTLLRDHYYISKGNLDAIEYAKNKGVVISVNTGRNVTSALYFSELAGMNGPVICCGGSLILEPGKAVPRVIDNVIDNVLKRKVLFEKPLPISAIETAGYISKETGVSFYAQSRTGYYIVGNSKQNQFLYDWDKRAISIIDMGLMHFNKFDDFMEVSKGNVVKMGFSSLNREVISALRQRWQNIDGCQTTIALGKIVEITAQGVNKGAAAKFVADKYGFTSEETACIGDDTNDISMFKECGTSVAVSGGDFEAVSKANFLVKSCEEDGVAEAIARLV